MRFCPLPVDPFKAEDSFLIEIEIFGQDVATRVTCDLKQVFRSGRSDVARTAPAYVTERECGLVTNGSKNGLLFR